jgi:hypothetical protein
MTAKKGRPKRVKPIIIDEIESEKFDVQKFFEKRVIKGKVPLLIEPGHIRVIVLKECEGMTGTYLPGDIIDLPERRFKSMCFRGLVEVYKGDSAPNKER